MSQNATVCLTASSPVVLSQTVTCSLGFFCKSYFLCSSPAGLPLSNRDDTCVEGAAENKCERPDTGPNNSFQNPPQYCPPTTECQITRLQTLHNSCSMPQGIYEPVACAPGFFCPARGSKQLPCPSHHYCPLGSFRPWPCSSISVCPSGSSRQLPLIGVFLLVIVDLILLIGTVRSRSKRQWSSWSKRQYMPFVRYRKKRHQMSSTVARQELEPLPEVTDEKFLHLQQFVKSLQSCLGLNDVGLEIDFHDLGFQIGDEKKTILNGVSGNVKPGSLLGIMGPSGAGKCSYICILPAMKYNELEFLEKSADESMATLVRLLMGKIKHTSGAIRINGGACTLSG